MHQLQYINSKNNTLNLVFKKQIIRDYIKLWFMASRNECLASKAKGDAHLVSTSTTYWFQIPKRCLGRQSRSLQYMIHSLCEATNTNKSRGSEVLALKEYRIRSWAFGTASQKQGSEIRRNHIKRNAIEMMMTPLTKSGFMVLHNVLSIILY